MPRELQIPFKGRPPTVHTPDSVKAAREIVIQSKPYVDKLPTRQLRSLHLFAGAAGGILADLLLGHRPVCAVEIEPYCQRVLTARQRDGILPFFPIWDDIKIFDGKPWRGSVDIVSGGFPCQKFSRAARGRNTAEDLWPEMLRVVSDVLPAIVFGENVSRGAIESAADDLRNLGYVVRAIEISASDMGADHIRARYWFFAYADDQGELLRGLYAEMALCPGIQTSFWETFPEDPRVDDGLADRMDRYKASGNGQIPAVAALAWKTLMPRLRAVDAEIEGMNL